jgi:hypothetical protein
MYVTDLTKFSDLQQKTLLRAFARSSVELRVDVFKLQKNIFYELREKNKEQKLEIISYCSFILAIEKIFETDENIKREFKLKQKIKNSKKEKLLSCWAIILKLKNEQSYSFRDIAKYLKKYHKFEISHGSIFQAWQNIEGKNDEK